MRQCMNKLIHKIAKKKCAMLQRRRKEEGQQIEKGCARVCVSVCARVLYTHLANVPFIDWVVAVVSH